MEIEAIIFDYDGTLVHLNIDFQLMRRGVDSLLESFGIAASNFQGLLTLETIDKASELLSQRDPKVGRSFYQKALKLVTDLEVGAARKGKVLPGITGTLRTLKTYGIKVGIITRNCEQAVRVTFPHIEGLCDAFIPRDAVSHVKPHPVHLQLAMEKMGITNVDQCLMVGDHPLDVEAGRRVGMKTAGVLTGHTNEQQFLDAGADIVLQDATEVLDHMGKGERTVRNRFLPSGKLGIHVLNELLERYASSDARVVIGPRIGEDTAAIDMGEKVIVVTTDPVTFATDEIGYYSVVVNANDIATSGAEPKWFTVNILLPEKKTDKALVDSIFRQIHQACQEFGISLIGGHTEITCGLDRPILVGHMIGEVAKEAFVTTGDAKIGDDVLLSKGLCIEGTSIIARERGNDLRAMGVPRDFIERAQNFLYDPGISIIKEAHVACHAGRVHSMHDVTEGGLANGLHEIAMTAKAEVVVEKSRIPVYEESRQICEAFNLDPLGVIGSGALLIIAPPGEADKILDQTAQEGVPISRIGRIEKGPASVHMISSTGKTKIPYFRRDEILRIFEESPR
jgi:hydrogenase expression/formation protein HypE